MDKLIVNIVNLSDEILLYILNKHNNFDVLNSLIGVHKNLGQVLCGLGFTRLVNLTSIEPLRLIHSKANAVLDQFCVDILPRISDNVGSLTLQATILSQVLSVTKYPNLRKFVINGFRIRMACHIFDGS
ncbi:unnamed protein product [Adineta ricciae]|uniref:Uncharacterized protein n=1 Tax=Adineta ricciae TaxID=249248 RepID=A0A815H151_ADIRI|nr:unnamed protein product [Adineta ricciae]CAF1634798.1 unnamed protein product [Adineta ricciae]